MDLSVTEVFTYAIFFEILKFNDSECVKNRAYKNSNNNCGSEVSDNDCVKLSGLEG